MDTEQIRSRHDLLALAQRLTTLTRIGREWKGPCPKCGGSDRFAVTPKSQLWNCRVCGTGGDVIALVMHTQGLNFRAAIEWLGEQPEVARRVPDQTAQDADWTSRAWQERIRSIITVSRRAISANVVASEYLTRRGILEDTARAYALGYMSRFAAISIPWIARDGRVTALKWRHIAPSDPKLRFGQMRGGQQLVFGAHLYARRGRTIIVEGEFNAMSVYQVVGGRVDVLSVGGDSNARPLMALLSEVPRALVWMDSSERAHRYAREAPRLARWFVSPNGLDANDILVQHGPEALSGVVMGALQ